MLQKLAQKYKCRVSIIEGNYFRQYMQRVPNFSLKMMYFNLNASEGLKTLPDL